MVTKNHEGPLRLFQDDPEAPSLIIKDTLGISIGNHVRARPDSEALTERHPVELNCDGVTIYEDENGKPVHAIITEVQRSPDDRKYYTWPAYVSNLFARCECKVTLVVIATNQATAKWANSLVSILGHPGMIFEPLVLGPSDLPLILKEDGQPSFETRSMLAMIVNQEHRDFKQAAFTYMTRIAKLPIDQMQRYTVNALSYLDGGALTIMEALMKDKRIFPYGSPLLERTQREAEARGEVKKSRTILMKLLQTRGLSVTADVRKRIDSCTDAVLLDTWLERAFTANSLDDVFHT